MFSTKPTKPNTMITSSTTPQADCRRLRLWIRCKLLDTIFFKNLLEVTTCLHDSLVILALSGESSVARQFECPDEIGMYREPVTRRTKFVSKTKTSRYDFFQKSLEVTSCFHDTKLASSVRVFFVAQRRKMY